MTTALLTRGSAFGDIKLTHTLGSGGFSDVYLGTDTRGRKLAVKVLRLSKELLEGQNERVNRERDVLGSIDSRGVAKLIKSDLTGEHPWIASEFIEGLTLRESIARDGEMSLDETLGLVRRIAEILDELHSAGIAHRDLTPNNIVVGDDGPVIIDFGSARVDLENTSTGSVLLAGTQAYAAPETIRGEPTGRSGDIFALARIAQFCISGSDEGVPQLPSSIQAGLRDDPEQRPSAKEISESLTDFAGPIDRFRVSEKSKLPRRVRVRTLVAASLLATAVTAGATAWWLAREAPVYSLTEDEISEFAERTFLDAERSHLGNPYFADPVIPAEVELSHGNPWFNSAPHVNSATLGVLFLSESSSIRLSESQVPPDVVLSVSPAPRWLREESKSFPKSNLLESDKLGRLPNLYGAGEAEIQVFNCDLPKPTHGAYIPAFDLFVFGSSAECDLSIAKNKRFYFVMFQPSTESLFRLSGFTEEIDRQEILTLLRSVVKDPVSTPSVVLELQEDETVADALVHQGYTKDLEASNSYFPYSGRIAVRAPAGSAIGVATEMLGVDIWALTDDELAVSQWSSTIPIGRYFLNSTADNPVVENYLQLDLVIVIEVTWSEPQVPYFSLLRFEDIQNDLEVEPLDQLFSSFSDTTEYFVGVELTDQYVETVLEVLYPGVFDENSRLARSVGAVEWTPLLPLRIGGEEALMMEVVQFGEIEIAMPPNLTVTTETIGELTYSARANRTGLRTEVLKPDMNTSLLMRNSSVILPGASGEVRVDGISEISKCRVFQEGQKMFGPLIGYLSVESICLEDNHVGALMSDDRIDRFPTRIRLILSSPQTDAYPWTTESESLEIFYVEMFASYVQDLSYMEFVMSSLERSLNGMSVEEARAAFGRPIHDVGVVDTFDLYDYG